MNTLSSHISLRGACLLAGLALALGGSAARGADTNKDAFPNYDAFIKVTGVGTSVTGSPSAFARRTGIPENGAYGIEALQLSKDLDNGTTLSIDGKAMLGSEDYLGKVRFDKNEVGSFDLGYKRFRTFYDGIGGFFPLNNRWNQLTKPELHTDRARFWATAKIERPNAPKFEFRYTNDERTGKKDTTIWGDTDFTGIPSYYGVGAAALNPYSTNRKIVPAYITLDERQQEWLGAVKHTVGNTELEFEIVHNTTLSNDRRIVSRYPGELQAFPRPSSSTNPPKTYPQTQISNEVEGYDLQHIDATVTTYTGKFETKMTDQVSVFGGVLRSTGSNDIGGDRQMLQYIPVAGGGVVTAIGGFIGTTGRPPYSYKTTAGKVDETVTACNFGVKLNPAPDLFASVAAKYEKQDVNGYNQTIYTSNQINQTTGAITPVIVNAPNLADRSEKGWVPEGEIRYTGIKNVALYANVEYRNPTGTEYGSSTGVGIAGVISGPTVGNINLKLTHTQYKVGANWTVNPMVSLRGEVFYKDHTNSFLDIGGGGTGFVLGYKFTGTKLTAIVKPTNGLSFTTRLVTQKGTMDTSVDSAEAYQSNDTKVYQFGETIDWSPNAQAYVQANINVVFSTVQTGYPRAGGLANDVLRNADNNYVNGSLVTGWVVERDTDASLQFTYYRADNYHVPTYATQWFGAGVKEYTLALALKHKFTDKLVGNFKVGYIDSENDTTGGMTNFKGPMAYVSFDHAL